MRFELCTAGWRYDEAQQKRLEHLGFEFVGADDEYGPHKNLRQVGPFIDINTLEELMAFREHVGSDLVLGDETITIYDDYME